MRTTIGDYVQDGPDGKFFFRMMETVLSRDKNWVRWKMESCPPISKPPISGEVYEEASKQVKTICASKRVRAVPVGAIDLSFLSRSNMPDPPELSGLSSEYVWLPHVPCTP
jgi:THO complex subunit 1